MVHDAVTASPRVHKVMTVSPRVHKVVTVSSRVHKVVSTSPDLANSVGSEGRQWLNGAVLAIGSSRGKRLSAHPY